VCRGLGASAAAATAGGADGVADEGAACAVPGGLGAAAEGADLRQHSAGSTAPPPSELSGDAWPAWVGRL
jgi:hypothetical protein